MGLIRKTLAAASAVVAPGASRNGNPGFIAYRSDAELARREQTALLREQTELLRWQAQSAQGSAGPVVAGDLDGLEPKDVALPWYCEPCVNAGCWSFTGATIKIVNPKLCECATHHA